jgi:GNAT superfamily N-acetyltransferase
MIRYTSDLTGLRPAQLAGPFWAGWRNPPAPEDHLRILQGSHAVWLAIDAESGDVVRFINAVSDGVLSAYIPLLEVVAPYQGQGIGTELMRRMLGTLRHLYQIDLMCDDDVRPFYERLGMQPAGGMVARNYDRQSAAPLDRNK